MDTVQPQKRRGPKPTGKGHPVQVRLQPDTLAKVDAFVAKRGTSRPKAIIALVEAAVKMGALD